VLDHYQLQTWQFDAQSHLIELSSLELTKIKDYEMYERKVAIKKLCPKPSYAILKKGKLPAVWWQCGEQHAADAQVLGDPLLPKWCHGILATTQQHSVAGQDNVQVRRSCTESDHIHEAFKKRKMMSMDFNLPWVNAMYKVK
jgi:hypothetical protein